MSQFDTGFQQIFVRTLEEAYKEGKEKAADGYWTDMFHVGGPHNVGLDILEAVDVMKLMPISGQSVDAALLTLGQMKIEYTLRFEDPDGFGLRTFNQMLQNLFEEVDRRGVKLPFTIEDVAYSGRFLTHFQSYAKGSLGDRAALVEIYRKLDKTERQWVEKVLMVVIQREASGATMNGIYAVDRVRAFYAAVGDTAIDLRLMQEKMELMAKL